MELFCRHQWEVRSDTVLPSIIEQMKPGGHLKNALSVGDKKHICIMTCSKCGKIYKSVEVNP